MQQCSCLRGQDEVVACPGDGGSVSQLWPQGAVREPQPLSSGDWTKESGDGGKMLPVFSSAAVLGF